MLEGVPDLTLALLNAALTPLGQGARRDPKSVPEALLRAAMNTTTVSSLSPVSSSASSSLPNSASVAWARWAFLPPARTRIMTFNIDECGVAPLIRIEFHHQVHQGSRALAEI
jgi:hypothetical protein